MVREKNSFIMQWMQLCKKGLCQTVLTSAFIAGQMEVVI